MAKIVTGKSQRVLFLLGLTTGLCTVMVTWLEGVLSSCPSVPRGPEDTKPWLGGVAALCTPRWHAFSKQGDEAGEEATSSVCRRQPGSPGCKGAHVFSSGFQGVRAYRETLNKIVLFGAKSPQYCLFSKAAAEHWILVSCQFTLRCPEVSFFSRH